MVKDEDERAAAARALEAARELLSQAEGLLLRDLDLLDVATWLNLRAGLGELTEAFNDEAKRIDRELGVGSARERLRRYFRARQGEVICGAELAGVAGIHEWARRVRELSLEEGWRIIAGPHGGLKHGTYRLDVGSVDEEGAAAWRLRNEISRRDGSAASRLLAYLQAIYPQTATMEDLTYVAKISEWPRRMRELDESGWNVISSNDDPTLSAGSYRLGSLAQGPPRTRQAIKQRAAILERDNWTCQDCGTSPLRDSAVRLQIHHLHAVQHGGGNEDENLVTLCRPCHAGRHALSGDKAELIRDEILEPQADPWA